MVPSADQIKEIGQELNGFGGIEVVTSSPYRRKDGELGGSAEKLKDRDSGLIFLNCFGYSADVKKVENLTDTPRQLLDRCLLTF